MNNLVEKLYEELAAYAMNVHEDTGWPLKMPWLHIMDTHGYKIKALGKKLALEELHHERADPAGALISYAKTYERGSANRLDAYRRVYRERPDLCRKYDQQVLGTDDRFAHATSALDQKVRQYMAEHKEADYKTAFTYVRAENPELAESWHYAGKRTEPSERHYQDKNESAAEQLLAAAKKVKQVISGTLMDALMEVAEQDSGLVKRAAGEWVASKIKAKPGSPSYKIELRELLKKHPGLGNAWNAGVLTEPIAELLLADLPE